MGASIQTWTRSTLASHIVGELNQDRSAAGGTVPARLTNIVHESFQELWNEDDWLFKRVTATLTLTADTATADLPDAFEKLDPKWLHENNDHGTLYFTDDAHPFEDRVFLNTDDTGNPVIARIQPKTSETSKYVWQVEVTPTPDQGMTYRYVYLRQAPAIDDDTVILWPNVFHQGWHFLSLARCQRAFEPGDAWKETYAAYMHWLERAKTQNNETLRASTPSIRDGNAYWDSITSTAGIWDYV